MRARLSLVVVFLFTACRTVDPWVWPASDAGSGTGSGATSPRDGGARGRVTPEAYATAGPGGGTAFDPNAAGASKVELAPNGGLRPQTVDGGVVVTTQAPILWVANSAEGTVSKVDARNLKELARYVTYPGGGADPSRTTVSLDGDLVVANRSIPKPERASAVKIAGGPERCVDRNGNGKIDTSSGSAAIPWPAGQTQSPDECVLWKTDLPAGSLPRAAGFDTGTAAGATVYIGLHARSEVWRLSGSDGTVLAKIATAPVAPYGMVVDGQGAVWVASLGGPMARIDPANGDKVTITTASGCAYGIAADGQGRVYNAGFDCLARYTPKTGTWERLRDPSFGFLRGLAVDGRLGVWVADTNVGMHHVDASGPVMVKKGTAALKDGDHTGAAIDFDDRPWLISQGLSAAFRVNSTDYTTQKVAVGNGPYTYSDMTGYQLRNAAGKLDLSARYVQTFTACNGGLASSGPAPLWADLSWTAELPAGSSIQLAVRTGATANALNGPFTTVATAPPATAPVPLYLPSESLLQVEVKLLGGDGGVPVLTSLRVGYACPRPTLQ